MSQSTDPGFRIEVESTDGRQTIMLLGELDLAVAAEVEETLSGAVRSDAGQIVLDISKLTFIDSTGVSVLVATMKRDGVGERFRVKPPQADAVRRVLALTGLEERLPYVDDGRP